MTRNLKDPQVQTVHFERTAEKDSVTGEVTYNDWTPQKGQWEKVEAPAIEGFEVTPKEIDAQDVTPDTKNVSVNFMYTAISLGITVNFTDSDNANSVVGSVTLNGLVGQKATEASNYSAVAEKVSELQGKGYDVTAPDLSTVTFTDKAQNIAQTVTHHVITNITKDNPQGVSDLTRDVTRTINFVTNN